MMNEYLQQFPQLQPLPSPGRGENERMTVQQLIMVSCTVPHIFRENFPDHDEVLHWFD